MMKAFDIGHPLILAVISGKGGVGKTMTSVNLAETLGRRGLKVALVDADGLSNCATALNEPVNASVTQWVDGECGLEDLPQNCGDLTLVTGADGPGYDHISDALLIDALGQVVQYLAESHEILVIDTPAGAGDMTLWALDQAHKGIIVLVDEPTALSDIYRLCKYVFDIRPDYLFASVVNFAESPESARNTYERFNTILNYFLRKEISYLGPISASQAVRDAVRQQRTLHRLEADPGLLQQLETIAGKVIEGDNVKNEQVESPIL